MNKKHELRIGLIGSSLMCKAHSNAYKTIPYIFHDMDCAPTLAALCAREPEKTRRLADLYGYAKAYTDVDEFLSAPLDIVDICTPEITHKELILKALGANKAVICEKPLALTPDDTRQIMLEAGKRKLPNAVCFNYRFLPAVRTAYDLIHEGKLGTIRHMYSRYYHQNGADENRPIDELRYARNPDYGSLQIIGSHAIDQMRFLAGEIVSLSAMTKTHVATRRATGGGTGGSSDADGTGGGDTATVCVRADDSAAALIAFDSGATGILECGSVYWGRKNQLAWEIYGSKGSLGWDLERPNELKIYLMGQPPYQDGFTTINVTGKPHAYSEYWWPGGHNIGWEHGHINMLAHILGAFANNKSVASYAADFSDGHKVAQIINAIRESARTGNRVETLK